VEKERRESKIREYGMRINMLWDKLRIPIEEREEFFDRSTQTLGPSAVKSVRSPSHSSVAPFHDSGLTSCGYCSAKRSSNVLSCCTETR
jgi:hypothetical protein